MRIVILGNGITGVTAARHVRKLDPDVQITVVSSESDRPWSRPALMYVYMGQLRYRDTLLYEEGFWAKNRIELLRATVTGIDPAAQRLHLADDAELAYDRLLIATGSTPRRGGWPGEHLARVGGMYSLQDLVALERATDAIRHGVVVGGGLIGVELAEMLHARGRGGTLVVREPTYWAAALPSPEGELVARAIRAHGIELLLGAELHAIGDDGRGGVEQVTLTDGRRIRCDYVGVAIGVQPNLSALDGSGLATARGVRVDAQLRTSAPNIWAAGDCAHIHPGDAPPFLEQVWYTGRAQGELVAHNLLGAARRYEPGVWFNSAKFFHLEYQVVGQVPTRPDPTVRHLYWEDAARGVAFRLCEREGRTIGVHALGIRLRHRVWERWIVDGLSAAAALDQLDQACFDPELHDRPTRRIRAGIHERSA